jgi:hypothetical protein
LKRERGNRLDVVVGVVVAGVVGVVVVVVLVVGVAPHLRL